MEKKHINRKEKPLKGSKSRFSMLISPILNQNIANPDMSFNISIRKVFYLILLEGNRRKNLP
jgi:hypothetical protein